MSRWKNYICSFIIDFFSKVCLQPNAKENLVSKKPFPTWAKDLRKSCNVEKAQALKALRLGLGPWIWPKIVTFVATYQNCLKIFWSFFKRAMVNIPSLFDCALELLKSFPTTFYAFSFLDSWVVMFSFVVTKECGQFGVITLILNYIGHVSLLPSTISISTSTSFPITRENLNPNYIHKN